MFFHVMLYSFYFFLSWNKVWWTWRKPLTPDTNVERRPMQLLHVDHHTVLSTDADVHKHINTLGLKCPGWAVVFTESLCCGKCRKHHFALIERVSFGKTSNCLFPWKGMGSPITWRPWWRRVRCRFTGDSRHPIRLSWLSSCEHLRSALPWFWEVRLGQQREDGGGLPQIHPEGSRTAGSKPRIQWGRRGSRESVEQSSPPEARGCQSEESKRRSSMSWTPVPHRHLLSREGVMRYATERQLEESEFLELHSYQGQKKSGYLGVDFDYSVFLSVASPPSVWREK